MKKKTKQFSLKKPRRISFKAILLRLLLERLDVTRLMIPDILHVPLVSVDRALHALIRHGGYKIFPKGGKKERYFTNPNDSKFFRAIY